MRICKALTAALTLLVAMAAYAERPDLQDAKFVQEGVCHLLVIISPCTMYEKEGARYIVYRDQGEVIEIFRVRDGATAPYKSDDFLLIWAKDEVAVV